MPSTEERMQMTLRGAAAAVRPQTARTHVTTVNGERADQRSLLQARLVRARLSAHAEVQKETKEFLASVMHDANECLQSMSDCAHLATCAYIQHLEKSQQALLQSYGVEEHEQGGVEEDDVGAGRRARTMEMPTDDESPRKRRK